MSNLPAKLAMPWPAGGATTGGTTGAITGAATGTRGIIAAAAELAMVAVARTVGTGGPGKAGTAR